VRSDSQRVPSFIGMLKWNVDESSNEKLEP